MGTSARASALAYCALSVLGSLLSAKTAEWLPRSSPILALQAACASAWFVWRRRRRTSLASVARGAARAFPLALAFSAALWTRMEANRHLTQSTIVVARHLIPLVTIPLERVVLGRPIRPSVVAPLACVALGAALYADAPRARFSPRDTPHSSRTSSSPPCSSSPPSARPPRTTPTTSPRGSTSP